MPWRGRKGRKKCESSNNIIGFPFIVDKLGKSKKKVLESEKFVLADNVGILCGDKVLECKYFFTGKADV